MKIYIVQGFRSGTQEFEPSWLIRAFKHECDAQEWINRANTVAGESLHYKYEPLELDERPEMLWRS